MPLRVNTLHRFYARCRALVRRTRWGDLLTFLLFVLLAAVLWYGHAMHSVRNAVIPVFVTYTGIPDEVGLQGNGLPEVLMVEVRDAGKRLRIYQKEPPKICFDLSSQTRAKKGSIRLSSDVLRRSITDMLQGTSSLIMVDPEQIECPYYKQQKRSIPIVWRGTVFPAAEYQLVGAPTLSVTEVEVYGKSEQIDSLSAIFTDSISLTELKDTTQVTVALCVPDGVRILPDSVCLTIITERFTEKVIRVPVRVRNVPSGEKVRLFPHEIDVTVRVGINHFSNIHEDDIVAECTYPTPVSDKLAVELTYTNPYITNARAYPNEVEFIIEKQ